MTEPARVTPIPAGEAVAPRPLGSRATEVTFFEDRAEVVREATTGIDAGLSWVPLAGVSPVVDDRSLRAEADGAGVRVVGARVRRVLHHEPVADRAEIDALERDAREARGRAERAERASALAESRVGRTEGLLADWVRGIARVPRGLESGPLQAAWRTAREAAARATVEAERDLALARAAARRAEHEADRAEARLVEARRERPRLETIVEVQLDAAAATEATVRVRYRTACAVWRPEHLARLLPVEGGGHVVELVTFAIAWQATGESWREVACAFSTARTARATTPPVLVDDVLRTRRKTEEERRTTVVEARDQAIATTGAEGTRRVDEMPGVDDGGEPLRFRSLHAVTIPSDGRPTRVEVARRRLEAEVALVAVPERAAAPHLRARATLAGDTPLLAGPVVAARGDNVTGRGRTAFVGVGDRLELGLGPDDAVRLRRTTEESRDTTTLVGTQKIRRKVTVHVTNLGTDERALEVVERVPVSELEGLTVSVDAPGWTVDGDGIARRSLRLAGGAAERLTLAYEVRAASDLRLTF